MIYTYLALQATLAALSLWGYSELSRFLRLHPAIVDNTSLDAFKRLARRNMYAAMAWFVLGSSGLLLGVYMLVDLGSTGLAIVAGANAPLIFLSKRVKALEAVARNASCANDDLLAIHRKVGEAWTNRLFPDF